MSDANVTLADLYVDQSLCKKIVELRGIHEFRETYIPNHVGAISKHFHFDVIKERSPLLNDLNAAHARFKELSDDEVRDLLNQKKRKKAASPPPSAARSPRLFPDIYGRSQR